MAQSTFLQQSYLKFYTKHEDPCFMRGIFNTAAKDNRFVSLFGYMVW